MRIRHLLVLAAAVGLAGYAGGAWSHDGHDEGAMGTKTVSAGEAAQGHSHEKSARHGGQVTMTEAHHFETVFTPAGVQLYVYTGEQAPAMVSKATGTATFLFADGTKKEVSLAKEKPTDAEAGVYFCPMHAEVVQMEPGQCEPCGGMKLFKQDRLTGALDLSKTQPGTVKATIHVTGLKGDETEATFTETVGTLATAPAAGGAGASPKS